MFPVKRILCPTDLSDPAQYALSRAVEIARESEAEIVLLHVVPEVPPLPEGADSSFDVAAYTEALGSAAAGKLAEAAKEHVPTDVAHRALVKHGDAAAHIMMAADDEKVDLIVIASRGMSGWHHFVFGSVTEKVVRLAHCPVLTVRHPDSYKVK